MSVFAGSNLFGFKGIWISDCFLSATWTKRTMFDSRHVWDRPATFFTHELIVGLVEHFLLISIRFLFLHRWSDLTLNPIYHGWLPLNNGNIIPSWYNRVSPFGHNWIISTFLSHIVTIGSWNSFGPHGAICVYNWAHACLALYWNFILIFIFWCWMEVIRWHF